MHQNVIPRQTKYHFIWIHFIWIFFGIGAFCKTKLYRIIVYHACMQRPKIARSAVQFQASYRDILHNMQYLFELGAQSTKCPKEFILFHFFFRTGFQLFTPSIQMALHDNIPPGKKSRPAHQKFVLAQLKVSSNQRLNGRECFILYIATFSPRNFTVAATGDFFRGNKTAAKRRQGLVNVNLSTTTSFLSTIDSYALFWVKLIQVLNAILRYGYSLYTKSTAQTIHCEGLKK